MKKIILISFIALTSSFSYSQSFDYNNYFNSNSYSNPYAGSNSNNSSYSNPYLGSQSNPNSHYVEGHWRGGTYIDGYYRTNPNNTKRDNYSTWGNYNPWNGSWGTIRY